jgi:hypothetical protein
LAKGKVGYVAIRHALKLLADRKKTVPVWLQFSGYVGRGEGAGELLQVEQERMISRFQELSHASNVSQDVNDVRVRMLLDK